jgi:hypothetical protein
MATENKVVSGPVSHPDMLAERLDKASEEGFEVEHFSVAGNTLHVLLVREAKDATQ